MSLILIRTNSTNRCFQFYNYEKEGYAESIDPSQSL